ncbi:S-adenosylmethionine-dependent methyltransferase [Bacteriovorax sp. BSW11_IV]|uniref:class I SAM-dependent methyltransferase n=1 Tax=Bacteriovorax sp. BSW11_IV TaxID=1353529 RepID=UPI00038A4177|nr:class I SAM-dependent methyltransferase [Bacteriovorax sp. BSW11_IV]EQC49138.1 S-adenosylmethionine-dependent methyltransferase [Bacteriovorax sp. BSW11_IV]
MSDIKFSPIENKIKQLGPSDRARRIFHGRGGLYEGLEHICIDQFKNDILVTLFKEEESIDDLMELVSKSFCQENIFLQKRYAKEGVQPWRMRNELSHVAHWEDIQFELDFKENQNIGYFLDIENGRQYLKKNSSGKKILNLFSYTCALSVIALKNGAHEVVNVDMSKGALSKGKRNHVINDIDLTKVRFLGHDVLKSFGKLTKLGPFDGVIIDPPSNQGKSFYLEKDYPKILKRVEAMCAPGAWLMICANSPFLSTEDVKKMVQEHATGLVFVEVFHSGADFEEREKDQGLKGLIYLRA